jgi:hypothetical protein
MAHLGHGRAAARPAAVSRQPTPISQKKPARRKHRPHGEKPRRRMAIDNPVEFDNKPAFAGNFLPA